MFLLVQWIFDLGRVFPLVYCGYFWLSLEGCIFVYCSLNNFFPSSSFLLLPPPCYFLQLLSRCGRECYRSWWSYLWSSLQNSIGLDLHLLSQFVFSKHSVVFSVGTESIWCCANLFPFWFFCSFFILWRCLEQSQY